MTGQDTQMQGQPISMGAHVSTTLTTSDFDYDLPEELIAQTPVEPRDASRLMVMDRHTGAVSHHVFSDIVDMLSPGDVLVINDSKVIPARLRGYKAAKPQNVAVEMLLLRQRQTDVWEVIVHPGRRLKAGAVAVFGDGILHGQVLETLPGGNRLVKFSYDTKKYQTIYDVLDAVGTVPLPPYIHEQLSNPDRYQTVYAREQGSAAAPTAGLHFTQSLLEKIKAKGIQIVPVMLHVGLGTFRPVKVERIEDHVMHAEYISVSPQSADAINTCHARGGRVIAVGTTCCRTLESVTDETGIVHAMTGDTSIFIYPGYRFRCIDGLITNFHLPKSTLLMLVSAFAGKEHVMAAYEMAVREKYRFFSFGDAMFIG